MKCTQKSVHAVLSCKTFLITSQLCNKSILTVYLMSHCNKEALLVFAEWTQGGSSKIARETALARSPAAAQGVGMRPAADPPIASDTDGLLWWQCVIHSEAHAPCCILTYRLLLATTLVDTSSSSLSHSPPG